MSNIIGLEVEDRLAHWITMRNLREDVKQMKNKDENKYSLAIKKEAEIAKTLLKQFVA